MPGGRAIVIRGNARQLPLPDESVDLVVSSPPYYSLRSYTDQGRHYDAQIGAEPTVDEYIANLLDCTREWMRALKPTGSLFVNLGDTYVSDTGNGPSASLSSRANAVRQQRPHGQVSGKSADHPDGIRSKSLIGVPWRYALGCVNELGLTLRRDIIWNKPNGIPESVDDRCRTSHEYIFHIVKERRYFTGVDEIREPHKTESFARFAPGRALPGRRPAEIYNGHPGQTLSLEKGLHPAGRLPGSVWTIPVQPLIGPQCRLVWDGRTICWFNTWAEGERHMRILARDSWMWAGVAGRPSLRPEGEHYASFPMELPRRIITGWSPSGICLECGEGRRPVVTAGRNGITGYACACPDTSAPVRPSVILDPFGGTGCAALVAASLGRTGISVDYSHSYSRFARWRTTSKTERAKAMQVKKPPPAPDPRQEALFDMEGM